MKKTTTILLACALATGAAAQEMETFDSNSWQWAEVSSVLGHAYIVDGVMRVESNTSANIPWTEIIEKSSTHCELPIDPTKGFTIKSDAFVKKINDEKWVGVILNYIDDMNFMAFYFRENEAYFKVWEEGRLISSKHNQFKLPEQKKAALQIEIHYLPGELEFRVNDIQALLFRNFPHKIDSNGFGFFAYGKAQVDFDNVEVSLY